MTSTHEAAPRRRNAAETRERLLSAAHELFTERGFERTTIREVGQRAGVDPTLIARYFGSKAELYLAALRRDQPPGDDPLDLRDRALIERALTRARTGLPNPTLHAAVAPHTDGELQQAAMAVLERRLIEPTVARRDRDAPVQNPTARARAELAVAALAGVVLSRGAESLTALSAADPAELARVLGAMIDAALEA
ncbi:TetR family transcriptional regulator [uncultured Jatrophihabitans sp.]|uniref:TetR/AcrR family transcriptional regulator n=1 Tax=uncultured Jatrophihabitans sp. TaxID=1610747 RepID=UPI0035CC1E76